MLEGKAILAEIRALKEELNRTQNTLDFIIHGLRQDNRDLLNRIMAGDMKTYMTTSPASVAEMDFAPARQLAREDMFAKEHLVGEIDDEA